MAPEDGTIENPHEFMISKRHIITIPTADTKTAQHPSLLSRSGAQHASMVIRTVWTLIETMYTPVLKMSSGGAARQAS